MEPSVLGLVVDSSIVIDAERKHQAVEDLLTAIRRRFGEVDVVISAVTVAISGSQAARGITLPMDDLLIGVSAVEQGYALPTLNRRHFEKIPDLIVVSF